MHEGEKTGNCERVDGLRKEGYDDGDEVCEIL